MHPVKEGDFSRRTEWENALGYFQIRLLPNEPRIRTILPPV